MRAVWGGFLMGRSAAGARYGGFWAASEWLGRAVCDPGIRDRIVGANGLVKTGIGTQTEGHRILD